MHLLSTSTVMEITEHYFKIRTSPLGRSDVILPPIPPYFLRKESTVRACLSICVFEKTKYRTRSLIFIQSAPVRYQHDQITAVIFNRRTDLGQIIWLNQCLIFFFLSVKQIICDFTFFFFILLVIVLLYQHEFNCERLLFRDTLVQTDTICLIVLLPRSVLLS